MATFGPAAPHHSVCQFFTDFFFWQKKTSSSQILGKKLETTFLNMATLSRKLQVFLGGAHGAPKDSPSPPLQSPDVKVLLLSLQDALFFWLKNGSGRKKKKRKKKKKKKRLFADEKEVIITGNLYAQEEGGKVHAASSQRKRRGEMSCVVVDSGNGPVITASLLPLPDQQRTLNKLPTELRRRNFVDEHRLSILIQAKHAKNCVQRVHIPTELPSCMQHLVVG